MWIRMAGDACIAGGTGLEVIKLFSQFFVLVLQNQPIKMLDFLFQA